MRDGKVKDCMKFDCKAGYMRTIHPLLIGALEVSGIILRYFNGDDAIRIVDTTPIPH